MLKFTLRELLLVTLIVGLALGWWLRERHFQAELRTGWQTLARYHASAARWRTAALSFAEGMRSDGWHVAVAKDASNWTMKPRHDLTSQEARQLNDASPLPKESDLPVSAGR